MLPLHKGDDYRRGSSIWAKIADWVRLIFSEKTSRRLLGFLVLNLSFAFVELFYGIWTNSLGLISDSFHMFFDCTALLAGLAASVISRWRATEAFSYGYVRCEILAGFVNGLFLIFIAFFIFSEAVERAVEPPEVKHERLFIVSFLGFLVNLVGIFAFGHGHSHGGDDHGHSHGGGHSHGLEIEPVKDHGHSHDNHGHSHDSGHGHSHDSGHGHSHASNEVKQAAAVGNKVAQAQIMQGVFLHILADTLGSVGVIISSILIYYFNWMIADPICSMFIATLIGLSVIPLLRESIGVLMQRTPRSLDGVLPSCYQRVSQLEGVFSVQEPHFWTLCTNVYIGTIKLEVALNADTRYVLSQTHNIFTQAGVRQLYVQIDHAPM